MKRLLILVLVVFFVPMLSYGQMDVADGLLRALIAGSAAEQAIYYVQSIAQGVEQIASLEKQVEYTIKSYEQSLNNLKTIGDVKSWDDFTDWHNRQLYLERRAEENFTGMNVSVGNKNYSMGLTPIIFN